MEENISSMDIPEASTLENKKEDLDNEHESFILEEPQSPCSHEKSLKSILPFDGANEKYNHLLLHVQKIFKRMVVDAFIYHKYCKSHCSTCLQLDMQEF